MLKKVTNTYFPNKDKFFQSKFQILVILIGTLVWSLTMVRSGLNYPFGVGFWGANGHDGVWHLALAQNLSNFSLENPVFAGEKIKNYHLGFDTILAILNKITRVPISNLYFQILPPTIAILIGILVYKFVFLWQKSKTKAFWATFFVYFSSGFGFFVTFLRDRVITGESMFWAQQSVSTLINPPYALSLIFILSGLMFLQKYLLKPSTMYYVLSIVCFGLLIQIKAYAAILSLTGLGVAGVYIFLREKNKSYLKVFIGASILNAILFFISKSDSLSIFVWQPMWYLETMMSYSDRLGWTRFYSAMTTYKMGHIWFKLITSYLIAFLIFLVGNMGIRIVGFMYFYQILKRKIRLDETTIFLVAVAVAGVVIPMFFVQSGTPWNTIQFFYYTLFIFSIFTGIQFGYFLKKYPIKKQFFVYLLLLLFSFFGAWTTLQHYLPKNPQAIITSEELEALNFLKKQSRGVVFTYPFDEHKAKKALENPPRPLYFYDSTSYVSAFSGKNVYIEDEVNLNIMGYDWKERRLASLNFISNLDIKEGKEFLDKNNIKYLYLVKEMSPLQGELIKLGPSELGLVKIFENKASIIYRYGQDFSSN